MNADDFWKEIESRNIPPINESSRQDYLRHFMSYLKEHGLANDIINPPYQDSRIMLSCILGSFNYEFHYNVPKSELEAIRKGAHDMIAKEYNKGIGFLEEYK